MEDLIINGLKQHLVDDLKVVLHYQFKLKDLGNLKYFLGLEVAQSKTDIVLNQRKHA